MNTTASNARLHKMVGCALFAALTAVCSQLAIPMPWGVPINLALFAGAFAAKLPRKFGWLALGCVVGCAACYVLGTIWFMVLTGLDLPTSLTYCVIPYLPGDVIKIALASLLTIQLDKRMPKI